MAMVMTGQLGVAAGGSGCAARAPAPAPTANLVASAALTAGSGGIATGAPRAIPSTFRFVSLEGPFWVASGGYLIFSDVIEQNGPAARIYKYDPRTETVTVLPYPVVPTSTNGLAVDGQGRLLACERWNGVLARVEGNQRQVLADHSPDSHPPSLNAPNDLTVRADGNIYFSDTKWGARPGDHAPTAVYRVAPDGAVSVAFQVDMPNGVLLSPDGATLYVGSDAQDRLWKLPVAADGSVGEPASFIDAGSVPGGKMHVPDGLCTDDRGRVYVANNSADVSAIQIFESDGHFAGQIPIPAPPSNCTFGGADRQTLYVTTLHAMYELRVNTPGLP
jgi:gluconolactonase